MAKQWNVEGAYFSLHLGGPGGTFSKGQQEKYAISADGELKDAAKFKSTVERVRAVRSRMTADKLHVMKIQELLNCTWLPEPENIMLIKGFGSGLNVACDKVMLRDILAMTCTMLVWDGDPLDNTGFTKMVPQFLQTNPVSKALAFVLDYEVDDFMESWADTIEQFPHRIRVVAVDMKPPFWGEAANYGITEELKDTEGMPQWAQEYFLLGRLACKLTGSKQVLSLGGGGISAHEAKVSAKSGVSWTIYALSRGRQEQFPMLADWAAENPSPGIKLKRNLDPNEAMAFCSETNRKKKHPCDAFLRFCSQCCGSPE